MANVRQLLDNCQAVVRQFSGSFEAVIKQSSGRQAVDEKMNQWFQGTPQENYLVKSGRGRGQAGKSLKGRKGDIPLCQKNSGDEKWTIPSCPLFQGRGRGQHFQYTYYI